MKILKTLILAGMIGAMFTMAAGPSQAAVEIDPMSGWTGFFNWDDGLGMIDGIDGTSQVYWSIEAPSASYLDLVQVYDPFLPSGDVFAFYLNDTLVPWTSSYFDGDGYFHGELVDLYLAPGTHTITLYLTDMGSIFGQTVISGSGHADFSGISSVPLPGAVWMLGSGLLGLIGFRNRKKLGRS